MMQLDITMHPMQDDKVAWGTFDLVAQWLYIHVGGELGEVGQPLDDLKEYAYVDELPVNGSSDWFMLSRAEIGKTTFRKEWVVENEFWCLRMDLVSDYTKYSIGERFHYLNVDIVDDAFMVMFKLAAPWEEIEPIA